MDLEAFTTLLCVSWFSGFIHVFLIGFLDLASKSRPEASPNRIWNEHCRSRHQLRRHSAPGHVGPSNLELEYTKRGSFDGSCLRTLI